MRLASWDTTNHHAPDRSASRRNPPHTKTVNKPPEPSRLAPAAGIYRAPMAYLGNVYVHGAILLGGVCAAAFITLVLVNVLKFDWTQRITLGAAILFFAYFLGHTIEKTRSPIDPDSPGVSSQPASSQPARESVAPNKPVPPTPKAPTEDAPKVSNNSKRFRQLDAIFAGLDRRKRCVPSSATTKWSIST